MKTVVMDKKTGREKTVFTGITYFRHKRSGVVVEGDPTWAPKYDKMGQYVMISEAEGLAAVPPVPEKPKKEKQKKEESK